MHDNDKNINQADHHHYHRQQRPQNQLNRSEKHREMYAQ